MKMTPEKFLETLRSAMLLAEEQDRRLGTIPATYVSGRPKIIFDGEGAESTKTYPYLGSYTPQANDRVALLRFGHTWVVIGEVV